MQSLLPECRDFAMRIVYFVKGVKTEFHTHESDQILIVTAGKGVVATESDERVVEYWWDTDLRNRN